MKKCVRNSVRAFMIKDDKPYTVYPGNEEAGDSECFA